MPVTSDYCSIISYSCWLLLWFCLICLNLGYIRSRTNSRSREAKDGDCPELPSNGSPIPNRMLKEAFLPRAICGKQCCTLNLKIIQSVFSYFKWRRARWMAVSCCEVNFLSCIAYDSNHTKRCELNSKSIRHLLSPLPTGSHFLVLRYYFSVYVKAIRKYELQNFTEFCERVFLSFPIACP